MIERVLQPSGETRVSLSFVGDLMLARRVGDSLERRTTDILSSAVHQILANSEVSCGNLECPLVNSAERITPDAFRGAPQSLKFIDSFQILSLANNHIFDCGDQGIAETRRNLTACGISHVGVALSNEDAYRPVILRKHGINFPFFACTSKQCTKETVGSAYSVAYLENPLLAERIEAVRSSRTFVTVMFHGGNEYIPYPPPSLRNSLELLIEAGANLVVTHHPHVLGGYEVINNRCLIWYSLGDFVFDSDVPSRTRSGILQIEVGEDGLRKFRFVPTFLLDDLSVNLAAPELACEIERSIEHVSRAFNSRFYEKRYFELYCCALMQFQAERLKAMYQKKGARQMFTFLLSRARYLRHYGKKLLWGTYR